MTFEEFWKAILARNPTLQRRDATVPIEQVRRIAEQAHHMGAEMAADLAANLTKELFDDFGIGIT